METDVDYRATYQLTKTRVDSAPSDYNAFCQSMRRDNPDKVRDEHLPNGQITRVKLDSPHKWQEIELTIYRPVLGQVTAKYYLFDRKVNMCYIRDLDRSINDF